MSQIRTNETVGRGKQFGRQYINKSEKYVNECEKYVNKCEKFVYAT